MREIRIRPRIAEHDLQVKINNIKRLLKKDKVKVSVQFRGREFTHVDIGLNLLNKIVEATKDIACVEKKVSQDKQYFIILRSGGESVFKTVS